MAGTFAGYENGLILGRLHLKYVKYVLGLKQSTARLGAFHFLYNKLKLE